MRSIQISDEQAATLDRGENITIHGGRYIVVSEQGNVYEVVAPSGELIEGLFPKGERVSVKGRCTLLAKGPHAFTVGHVQHEITGVIRSITRLPSA